jgi:hypothetical protein
VAVRSKDDFIARWRFRLAGLALYGACSERSDGPMRKIERVYEIPGEVERLLGLLWDDMLKGDEAKAAPVANGLRRGPQANGKEV